MKIYVDQVVPTKDGLRLGCVAHYSNEGPVRFVDAHIPWEVLTPEVYAAIGIALDRMLEREPSEEPLF